MERLYYSQRNNLGKVNTKIDLINLKKLFYTLFTKYSREHYFDENFGFDNGNNFFPGKLGTDSNISARFYLDLRKDNLWPIYNHIDRYTEDDLFDIIEFCYDNISLEVYDSEFSSHYEKESGQNDYRIDINKQLKDYNEGFELNKAGHIVRLSSHGLKQLVERKLPTEDEGIVLRVNEAVFTYQNRKSSRLQRKEAVRHLGDILESLRKKAEPLIKKADESDLFQLINKFGIRHNNPQQKEDYDDAIFLSWMFHYFLATIHAWLLIIKRNNGNENRVE
jgi:hypothetical protein